MLTQNNYQKAISLLSKELKHVRDLFVSVILYGSCASGGPFWEYSDIDLLVITNDQITVDTLSRLSEVRDIIQQVYGAPPYMMLGTWPELRLILNPVIVKMIIDNGICIAGENVTHWLQQEHERFPPYAIQRGALKYLLFERYEMQQGFLHLANSIEKETMFNISELKRLWKNYIDAARFATWVFTVPGDRLNNNLKDIFLQFERIFPEIPLEMTPRAILEAMQSPPKGTMELTSNIMITCNQLIDKCVIHFQQTTGVEIAFVDPT